MKPPRNGRRPRPELDAAALDALALRYVGRFATSRGRLTAYLVRKIRERGWTGKADADPAAVAERLAALGYVDDASFAVGRARALGSRGLGARRVQQALQAAAISDDDGAEARALAEQMQVESALRFARKRRAGPYALQLSDPQQREKALAAMIRAGHGFALSRRIVDLQPGDPVDEEALTVLC